MMERIEQPSFSSEVDEVETWANACEHQLVVWNYSAAAVVVVAVDSIQSPQFRERRLLNQTHRTTKMSLDHGLNLEKKQKRLHLKLEMVVVDEHACAFSASTAPALG